MMIEKIGQILLVAWIIILGTSSSYAENKKWNSENGIVKLILAI